MCLLLDVTVLIRGAHCYDCLYRFPMYQKYLMYHDVKYGNAEKITRPVICNGGRVLMMGCVIYRRMVGQW